MDEAEEYEEIAIDFDKLERFQKFVKENIDLSDYTVLVKMTYDGY